MTEFTAIRFDNVSKAFGRGDKIVQAVGELDLAIHSKQVYGFLGPNGAGKTTTIRMMIDLIRPSKGKISIFGRDVRRDPAVLKRVGALVEGAMFYGYLSGRDNLEILAHTAGKYWPQRISALLDQVGLADSAQRAVSSYSMGMTQRLGIAAALLHDPELVILDEPTNGLDPAGIQEMRRFIRSLASEQDKTVFLSSHLLNEVEQTCDRVAIIDKGRLVREGAIAALLAEGATELRLQVSPLGKAVEALQERWAVSGDEGWLTVKASPTDSPHIVRHLVAQEISVYQVVAKRRSLEEYFMSVTQID